MKTPAPLETLPVDSAERYLLPTHRGKLHMPNGDWRLHRVRDVAEMFGVTVSRVRTAMYAGALPAKDLGGNVRRISSREIPVELVRTWREGKPLKPMFPAGPLVYFIAQAGYVKIGFSTHLAKRFESLQSASPVPLTVLAAIRGDMAMERELHAQFADDRAQGEWFRRSSAINALLDGLPPAASLLEGKRS